MKKIIFSVISLLASQFVSAAGVTAKVQKVGSSWNAEAACAYLSTGDIAKIDLSTQKGKAEFSIALSAKATNADVYIHFDDSKPLVGGCGTSTTVKPHGIITIQ